MGLDLIHAIPSLKSENTPEYFDLWEFDENPEFLERHSRLLTEIDRIEYDFEILVFPTQQIKEILIQKGSRDLNKPALIGKAENLRSELIEIGRQNGIVGKEPFILSYIDNLLSSETAMEIGYQTVFLETGKKKIKVLYWKQKGYQRKGMNEQFYEDFENCKSYYDKSAVLKAASYLSPPRDENPHGLETHFRENFIDNFVEGESIFWGSW